MGTTEETLRTEREARRASAERPAPSRRWDAIARYLTAFDYADRKLREQKRQEKQRQER